MGVVTIPTIGFARGAIVRSQNDGPNMLVVRGIDDKTVVITIEGDAGGQVRLREFPTADLHQVLASQTPAPPAPRRRDG